MKRLVLLTFSLAATAGCALVHEREGVGVAEPPGGTCSVVRGAFVHLRFVAPGVVQDDACFGPHPVTSTDVTVRQAMVVSVTDDARGAHVALDFCSPAADCLPIPGTLDVEAPDFALESDGTVGLVPGQYVEIRWRMRTLNPFLGGCTREIQVRNLGAWTGDPNPVRSDGALLFAAADGLTAAMEDAPFSVTRRSYGCVDTTVRDCGERRESFQLAFQGSDPDPLVLAQGEDGVLTIDGGTYTAASHQAFQSGACDDTGAFDWTVRELDR